jgi:hypothetical protein
MLAGVLLHQIEATGPVYFSLNLVGLERVGQEMKDSAIALALDYVEYGDVAARASLPKHARVVGLATASGIECGTIQHDRGPVLPLEALCYPRRKADQVGIAIV